MIKFNLMIRSRTSIIIKDKALAGSEKGTLPTSTFPNQNEEHYRNCRLLLSDRQFEKHMLEQDIDIMK